MSRLRRLFPARTLVHHGPRWVVLGGVVAGYGLGLLGFLGAPQPVWVVFWGAVLLGLVALGWNARLRQVGALATPERQHARGAEAPPRRWRPVQDGPLPMVDLPGGLFGMGSTKDDDSAQKDEKPQHRVTVSAFRIGVTPITVGQWREVMGSDPRRGADRLPVTDVSWEDAVRFCNALSERYGYQPCYRQAAGGQWTCDWSADGYRLPTEAEWEYACRAGTETRWCFGDDPAALGEYAWFEGNAAGHAHEVGTKRPNAWGLHDMHGNVWEWCWDWHGAYTASSQADPRGPAQGDSRVLRGGSFGHPPQNLRSAVRVVGPPVVWVGRHGFRCVRVPARPA